MVTAINVRDTFDDDGNLTLLQDEDAINQCVKVLLLTTIRELFGDPGFGSQLRLLIFKNMTDVLKDILTDHLTSTIVTYDRRITINNIDIEYDNIDMICYITISYAYQTTSSEVNLYISM